jgi:DNA-binding transcriptional ArsR family regulator
MTYKLWEFKHNASDVIFRTLADPTRRAILERVAADLE